MCVKYLNLGNSTFGGLPTEDLASIVKPTLVNPGAGKAADVHPLETARELYELIPASQFWNTDETIWSEFDIRSTKWKEKGAPSDESSSGWFQSAIATFSLSS